MKMRMQSRRNYVHLMMHDDAVSGRKIRARGLAIIILQPFPFLGWRGRERIGIDTLYKSLFLD